MYINASHILVDTIEEAQNVKIQLDNGEDFATLAINNSKCNSKFGGGNLGFFNKGMMVKEFEDAVFALKVGEISSPIKTNFGYHIIQRLY